MPSFLIFCSTKNTSAGRRKVKTQTSNGKRPKRVAACLRALFAATDIF